MAGGGCVLILEASARTVNFKVAKQIWQHHTAVSRNIPPKGKGLARRRSAGKIQQLGGT